MKTSRFSETQILGILKQAEGGLPVPELWRIELPVDVIQWARRGLIGNRRPNCLATDNAVQAHATHQPFHRVPRDGDALPLHLEPHFAGTIDLVVPLEDAADRWPQGRIPTHSCR